jgi:hypothetical protein
MLAQEDGSRTVDAREPFSFQAGGESTTMLGDLKPLA